MTSPATPPANPLRRTSRSLPIALLRARETVMGPIRDMLAQTPINEQKRRVLRVLDESGPLEQKSIALAACLLLPSLTRILQAMEADGLVSRTSDPADRRRTIVTITPQGAAIIADHAVASNAILGRMEEAFGADKLNLLLDLLEDLQKTRD